MPGDYSSIFAAVFKPTRRNLPARATLDYRKDCAVSSLRKRRMLDVPLAAFCDVDICMPIPYSLFLHVLRRKGLTSPMLIGCLVELFPVFPRKPFVHAIETRDQRIRCNGRWIRR